MKETVSKNHLNVAAGLIKRNGMLLITQRPSGSHLQGLWEFPGGKQEKNESLEQCLEREIEEELGLKVRAEKALLTVVHEYDTQIVMLHVFECGILEGKPECLQCQQFRWVKPSRLKEYSLAPADRKFIELFELKQSVRYQKQAAEWN